MKRNKNTDMGIPDDSSYKVICSSEEGSVIISQMENLEDISIQSRGQTIILDRELARQIIPILELFSNTGDLI